MRGNLWLAVLTLVVALFLLVPALLATWHSDRKKDEHRDERTGSDGHHPGRRPEARRPLPLDPYSPDRMHHSVHKVTITGGPGGGNLGEPGGPGGPSGNLSGPSGASPV